MNNSIITDHHPRINIYIDGIFDLFHYGHLKTILNCSKLFPNVYLIVGVIGDSVAESYKRLPIICEKQRYEIIRNIRCVNKVVENAPLIITRDFMELHEIDLVVHSFSNKADAQKQNTFFEVPVKMGKFLVIDYCSEISTSEIIEKIKYSQ